VDLKTVSPQEAFTCSLGVDPAVRVSYRPVRRFNEQTGMLNKSNVVTYCQEIEVNNTRPDAIHVVLIDQIPRSTEEKLKVKSRCFFGFFAFFQSLLAVGDAD
jgi:hypothetical protein